MSWYDFFFFWRKKEAAPIHEPPALPVAVAVTYQVPGDDSKSLNDIFLDAIQEVHEEQYEVERELLNDKKLLDYIKRSIKEIKKDLTGDSHTFIHFYPHDINMDSRIWAPFSKILIELFKTIDIPVEHKGSYLYMEKSHVSKAFDALKKQIIDIDERTRTMLSTGIYR